MSYAQYGLVQASDYNTLIGSSPGSTINTINTQKLNKYKRLKFGI